MPTKYATAKQLDTHKETIAYAEHVESDPGLTASIQDRAEFKKRKTEAQTSLHKLQAPGPKDDAERTSLRQRQNNLEAFIKLETTEIAKPAMPTQHEMWDTPAGAVGKHRKWEHAVKNYTLDPAGNPVAATDGYGAVFEWKDNQRRLRGEEEEWDGDIANIETLRPQNADKSSFADYRRMQTAASPAEKANYDEVFPDHEPTIVEAKILAAKRTLCGRPKKDGDACRRPVLDGKDYCASHQPKEVIAA